MKKKKTWAEKVAAGARHEVKPSPIDFGEMKKGQIMLIPSAKIVDQFIRKIPRGKSMDPKTLRKKLARQYRAEVACPITTGIHLRTVAEAAFEAYATGTEIGAVTPVWRVLDARTPTTQKLSCGPAFILEQRAKEGLP